MLSKIGTTELILIFAVALVVFGPAKLPELGRMAGRMVGSFKRTVHSWEREWEAEEEQTDSPSQQVAKEGDAV